MVDNYKDSRQIRSGTGVAIIAPFRSASANAAGSAAANAFQSALASSVNRKGCAIYNTSSAVELVYLDCPVAQRLRRLFDCSRWFVQLRLVPGDIVATDQIQHPSATAAAATVVVSQ